MNQIWSDNIQGVMTLYLSRKLRFDDVFFNQYEKLFQIDPNQELKILEIGCGPGALAGALHRWYPKAKITAIDRDSKFISFAKEQEPGVEFLEGDATELPFADETFDITISNTVCEHIEPYLFYGEQRRVLKKGGICLCLSARKGVNHIASCLEMTEEEKDFWESLEEGEDMIEKYQIGKYAMSEQELPLAMEQNGFKNVTPGYAVIDLTPDNPKYFNEMAHKMFEAERLSEIEAVESTKSKKAEEITTVINKKYQERIRLYEAGEKQWDTSTSITMVLRGVK